MHGFYRENRPDSFTMVNWDLYAAEIRTLDQIISDLSTVSRQKVLERLQEQAEKTSLDLFLQCAMGHPTELVLVTKESLARVGRDLEILKKRQGGNGGDDHHTEEEWEDLKVRLRQVEELDLDSYSVEYVAVELADALRTRRFTFEHQKGIMVLPKTQVDKIIDDYDPGVTTEEELKAWIEPLASVPSGDLPPDVPRVYATWLENLKAALESGHAPHGDHHHPRWFVAGIARLEEEIARREERADELVVAQARIEEIAAELEEFRGQLLNEVRITDANIVSEAAPPGKIKNSFLYLRSRWLSEPAYREEIWAKIPITLLLRGRNTFAQGRVEMAEKPDRAKLAFEVKCIRDLTRACDLHEEIKAEYDQWKA